jgi:hypothetical protein
MEKAQMRKKLKYNREWQRAWRDSHRKGEGLFTCRICSRRFHQIGSHVVQIHGYETAREYRAEFGYDLKKGQLSPRLRARKASHVFANGTVKNLAAGKKYWFRKGEIGPGLYDRSEQTIERLKNQSKKCMKNNRVNRSKNGRK